MGTRSLAVASSLLLAAALVAPAGAQEPTPATPLPFGAHRAQADGTALRLNVLGQEITLGLTEVLGDATPRALARGVGALVPGLGNVSELAVEATADGQTAGADEPTCGPVTLPADVPVLDLASACASALAAVAGGDPGTRASAGVANLAVSATELVQDTPLAELPVQATVEQVIAGLTPVFEVVGQLGLDADSLVRELLDGITQGGDLVRVTLGPTASSTTTEAAAATATATAQGATIEVIDRSLLQLPPVLTIEVGAASASVRADRATGEAVPSFDPALVRVTVAADVATVLGLPSNVIEVPVSQDLCLPLPAPLQSCVRAGSGRAVDLPDGAKRAEAEAVSIELLTGLPGGGITLALSDVAAEAGAGAPPPPAPQEAPREAPPLARTGGTTPLVLALALAALGLAGLGVRRRTS